MRNALIALVALAGSSGCQKTDPLYCGKHPGACDDGGNFIIDSQALATVGGTVTGLSGASGLVLQNNGGDDKPVVSDGAFQFPTPIGVGSMYNVTVSIEPTNPSEMCTVANGAGTAANDVTNVSITCGLASYTVGGTVFGLTGSLTLTDNGTDNLSIPGNGPFTFSMAVRSGKPYSVTSSSPSTCPVFGGTGIVGNADVNSVIVNCQTGSGPYAIGGNVTGLNGKVVLKNSTNGDTVSITANGTYAFPMLVPSAGNYTVSVQNQPTYNPGPANQTCTVSNGSSTANGNVTNINVNCVTNSFTVGGMVSGITGGNVVIENNLADDTTLTSSSTSYTFATSVLSGTPYSVTILSKPAALMCSISNKTGTVGNSNVTNANVSCNYMDPGIACGAGTYCTVGSQLCCQDTTVSCIATSAAGSCGGPKIKCDSKADCSSGNVCCANTNGGHNQLGDASCAGSCDSAHETLCDPMASNPCSSGTCQAWLAGYSSCR
jgi:hypothetical protein